MNLPESEVFELEFAAPDYIDVRLGKLYVCLFTRLTDGDWYAVFSVPSRVRITQFAELSRLLRVLNGEG